MNSFDHLNSEADSAMHRGIHPQTSSNDVTIVALEDEIEPFALRDQHAEIMNLLQDIPLPHLLKSSSLSYWLALAYLSSSRLTDGAEILREMELQYQQPDDLTAGRIAVVSALDSIFSGSNEQALIFAKQAVTILPATAIQERFRAWATTEVLSIHFGDIGSAALASEQILSYRDRLPFDQRWWYTFVIPNRADWLLKTGKLNEAELLLEAQLHTCPADTQDIIRIRLAIIALEKQELDRASQLIKAISGTSSDSYWSLEAELVHAAYLQARGETETAIAALFEAIRHRTELGSKVEVLRLQLALAEVWIDQGQHDLAAVWLELASTSIDPWPRTYGHPIPELVRARLDIAQGNWGAAERRLHILRKDGQIRRHDGLLIRIYSHLAYVAHRQGKYDDAHKLTEDAVIAGRHGSFVGSFLVNQTNVLEMQVPASVSTTRQGRGRASARSELSQRELEIIVLLESGKSNQSIADELFISINTVKNHLQNIFRKLEAGNRREAIEIAQSREEKR